MSNQNNELEKEFELERMILFSDAVFAIAITLLIIEIKFPEVPKGISNAEIFTLLKPVIKGFLFFVISFFFVGILWARHLNIFKYLQSYNNGVIFRNLLFLFFIVCFPFTASTLEHFRPSFLLPLYLYMINLAFVFLSQYLICRYIFSKKREVAKPGFEVEKNYLLLTSKYTALSFSSIICITVILFVVFRGNDTLVLNILAGLFALVAIFMRLMRRQLKKHKPVSVTK